MSSRLLLLGASCLALGACSSTVNKHIGEEDPYVGEAVKYDMAIQVVNPEPVYDADDAQPGANGEKGVAAVKRYRSDGVNARHRSESRTQSNMGSVGGGGGPQ